MIHDKYEKMTQAERSIVDRAYNAMRAELEKGWPGRRFLNDDCAEIVVEAIAKLVTVTVERSGYRCASCGHTWVPRVVKTRAADALPAVCPKCKAKDEKWQHK